MIAVDMSIVVAAFATWHESHGFAARIVADKPRLPAPAALEAYAVLTRLPPPHRAKPTIVRDFLSRDFPDERLVLPPGRTSRLVADLVDMGISGGASYDAVIAMDHGCELATLDFRAQSTYDAIGVSLRRLP